MARSLLFVVLVSLAIISAVNSFTPPSSSAAARSIMSTTGTNVPCFRMAVLDVDSEAEFDKKISSAGQKLVVIDYSTTWCGPCKVIAPKFDQLSDVYPDSVFIKVRT